MMREEMGNLGFSEVVLPELRDLTSLEYSQRT